MLTRRRFLARGAAGLAAAGSGPLLAACGQPALGTATYRYIPMGPARPITWPLPASNRAIRSGLTAERGATLRVLTWPGYVSLRCLDRFARTYHCQVELTTFATMSRGIAAMASPHASYDVLLGAPIDAIGGLVIGQLVQPLNRSYLRSLGDVWLNLVSPFYDRGSQYTVPYTARSTGIAWRKDLVRQDPDALQNGWTFLWQPKYGGKVGILDDYRESLSLGLLSVGNPNLGTADPMQLDAAAAALSDLARLTHMTVDNGAAARLAHGLAWIHHAWSGQVITAARMLPAGVSGDVLGYWFPPDGRGPVANDTMAVPRRARNPVLAHLFLNFLLDRRNAAATFGATGYVPPLRWLTPDRLVSLGLLPPNLTSAVAQPGTLRSGLRELPLLGPTQQLWQQVWSTVRR